MKTVYIIRHAKSSWGDFTLPDFERPLNERGKKDAPEMARRLIKRNIAPEIFVSSPAKRAIKTCKLFCEEYKWPTENILVIDELYHAPKEVFYKVINNISDQFISAAIFSHNPGITDFVNSLHVEVSIDNMPTCAVFAVSAEADHWKDFEKSTKKFIFFDYPKAV